MQYSLVAGISHSVDDVNLPPLLSTRGCKYCPVVWQIDLLWWLFLNLTVVVLGSGSILPRRALSAALFVSSGKKEFLC